MNLSIFFFLSKHAHFFPSLINKKKIYIGGENERRERGKMGTEWEGEENEGKGRFKNLYDMKSSK